MCCYPEEHDYPYCLDINDPEYYCNSKTEYYMNSCPYFTTREDSECYKCKGDSCVCTGDVIRKCDAYVVGNKTVFIFNEIILGIIFILDLLILFTHTIRHIDHYKEIVEATGVTKILKCLCCNIHLNTCHKESREKEILLSKPNAVEKYQYRIKDEDDVKMSDVQGEIDNYISTKNSS